MIASPVSAAGRVIGWTNNFSPLQTVFCKSTLIVAKPSLIEYNRFVCYVFCLFQWILGCLLKNVSLTGADVDIRGHRTGPFRGNTQM